MATVAPPGLSLIIIKGVESDTLGTLFKVHTLPTFKFPVKATLPFGFIIKQVVASEALITYELSGSIAVCHVYVIPSREN